jgi:hypothetical protein
MDPYVTLLEAHKLLYFMQVSGQSLHLKYTKAPFGPYAENLRHLLNRIEGHFISGYADGGDAPDKRLSLVPGAVKEAEEYFVQNPTISERFNKVADLVEGFETPAGLELLSTVHWAAVEQPELIDEQLVEYIYAWNDRKRQFSKRQILLAKDVLRSKGWL